MAKPKIRFKGYQDDWEQRKLSEIAIRVTEKNKNNEFTEPFTNSAELGIISQKEYFEREIVNDENLDGYYIVRKNDFVYNPRISGTAPVGPINRNRLERNGVMSPLYTVFRVHDIAELYLEYYFKTTNWHRFMKLNGDSGARFDRFTISSMQFMEMPIPYPKVEEQKKIGAYFSHLDHLITLHQRKCDEAKKIKKFMLQKMFPQNGSLVPEIRFDGFTDDWEQRKFGDLGSVAMCKRIFKEQTSSYGDIPFYKIGTFGTEPDAFISRELFEEYKEKFQYPNVGDMLISASGTIGRTVEYKGEKAYFQDSNIVWFKHDERIDNSFLKCIYEIVKWSGIEGSTIKRLYNDNFLKTEFSMPNIIEQQKIGEYFTHLDHLITLHQQKCEDLKNLKKYMLQNMFV